MSRQPTIDDELLETLSRVGVAWKDLRARAAEVVLFGSRAAWLAGRGADWDLLCVGAGKSLHHRDLDLVWVDPGELETRAWMGSELACHVAAYGRWLVGRDTWSRRVFVADETLTRKRRSIESRASALDRLWAELLPGFRHRHLVRLRRDCQRLASLEQGVGPAPSPLLDAAWRRGDRSSAEAAVRLAGAGTAVPAILLRQPVVP